MRFEHVALAAFAHLLPDEIVTSAAMEASASPRCTSVSLSPGRLELMTGIRERRFFPPGTRPRASRRAPASSRSRGPAWRATRIGVLIHGAVCRDFLEPATASVVHARLELAPSRCTAFDLSNACLGFVNAMCVIATRSSAARSRGDSSSRARTAARSSSDARALARPEPGGASSRAPRVADDRRRGAACVLAHVELAPDAPRLVGTAAARPRASTTSCVAATATTGLRGPLMETDSEALLQRRLRARRAHVRGLPSRARVDARRDRARSSPTRSACSTAAPLPDARPRSRDRLPDRRDPGQHRLGLAAADALARRGKQFPAAGSARRAARHRQRPAVPDARRALVAAAGGHGGAGRGEFRRDPVDSRRGPWHRYAPADI